MISVDSITSETIVLNKSLSTVLSPLQAEAFDLKSDSLHPHFYVLPKDLKVKSFITQGHTKREFNIQTRSEKDSNGSFYSGIVLLMFVGVLLSKLMYPRRFSQFIRAAFSTKALNLLL
ncbi:MAG: hypothetical protein Q8T08_25730, partial [Ignavibacteria bacterium]|nr:hypothetical protein [Ignavibacteria bacterium]